jgi:hypothetical protein
LAALALPLLALLGLASSATALPGDPPIASLTPAAGVSGPALEEDLNVTYSCVAYQSGVEVVEEKVENEEEEIEVVEVEVPVFGSTENYGVVFSTGSALGADGRLVSTGLGDGGTAEAGAIKGTSNCVSELVLPSNPNPAALYGGTVYWQPYRECEGCASGYEVGPVRSFVVVPTDEEAELTFEDVVYGGYMSKISFAGAAGLKGARVELQLWQGSSWETIATELGTSSGENTFFVTLGAGHKLLRTLVVGTPGTELGLEPISKFVRKRPNGGTAAAVPTGEWIVAGKTEQEEAPLSFKVTKGGTELRGLATETEASCTPPKLTPEPWPPLPSVPTAANSRVMSARISPTGVVVAHFLTTGATLTAVSLKGTFFAGRFSGSITSTFLGNCSGFREFEAVPAPPKKK